MNLLNNRMTYRIVQDIRSQAIRHIQVLPLSYLDQHSTGDIVSRVIADTDILSDGLLLGFTQLFSGIVTIVVTLIFMFSKNVWVTLLVIVLTPFSFVVAKFISSRSYTMFRKQSETRGRQTALIEEMIGGQKVVKAFGYEKESSRRFDEINKELQTYSQKAVFYSSLTNPSTRFVNNIIYAGVALLGAFLIPGGTLTVGGLSVLLSYANQYMKPFNDISSVITEMQNALACADRIFDLLEQKEETPDAEGVFATVDGNVTIGDVAFSYDKEKELIKNFNLDVKPGTKACLQKAWSFLQPIGFAGVAMHDTCPVMYLAHPELFRAEEAGVYVETRGSITRGKTVTDLYSDKQFETKNARVVLGVDRDRFIAIVKDCIKTI